MKKIFQKRLQFHNSLSIDEKREWNTLFAIYPFSLVLLLIYILKYNFVYKVSEYNFAMFILFISLISTIVFGFLTNNKHRAFIIYLMTVTFSFIFFSFISGGIKAPGVFFLTVLGSVYGLLYGKRGIYIGAIVSSIIYFAFIYLDKNGLNPNVIINHSDYQKEKNSNFFFFLIFISICFYAYFQAYYKAAKSLKDKNEQIESLLRILFHDVANPLAVIMLSSDMMLKRKTYTEETVLRINKAATNLKEQLESVKKLKALKDGKVLFEINEFHLKPMLDASIDMFSEKCANKGIRIVTEFDDRNVKVKVDYIIFINQVISNIISNSIKYSFENSDIVIRVRSNDENTCITIQDFGIGMPEEVVNHLFETDKVISKAGTGNESGTGYGLALAKYFIESFGGNLSVESTEKSDQSKTHGSSFTITLPNIKN